MEVEFIYDNSIHFGIVTNISGKGMCLNVGIGYVNGAAGKLFLESQGKHSVIPFKVRWARKYHNTYDVMGIELLEPNVKYVH